MRMAPVQRNAGRGNWSAAAATGAEFSAMYMEATLRPGGSVASHRRLQSNEAARRDLKRCKEKRGIRQLDMRIRFVTPDVAIAHVTNEISGMTGSDGTQIPPQRELNLRVFKKTNGKWLVTAFHSAPIGPSVAAARPR